MADPTEPVTTSRPPSAGGPLGIVALVKQIPAFEAMALGADGRLVREGLPLEMSAYCRRAVAEAVRLVEGRGGEVVVLTLGPPSAEDVLREAIAYGRGLADGEDHDVAIRGVHVCDEAFRGSDTLATARALAAAVARLEQDRGGAFDLVLAGRASVDADTGQVPPELAELLDRAFATGVKALTLRADGTAAVGCELDDVWQEATVRLPAVLSAAERLIDPCKIKAPAVWAMVDAAAIERWTAADLGPGPWGTSASPTWVGETRVEVAARLGEVLEGPVVAQVERAVALLHEGGAIGARPGARHDRPAIAPAHGRTDGPIVAVVGEPGRGRATGELLGEAAELAAAAGGRVVLVGEPDPQDDRLDWSTFGADERVVLRAEEPGLVAEEDVAQAVGAWARTAEPWVVLVGGTSWGREVASRVAASLGAGLTGDAVGLEVDRGDDGRPRLVAWKPAFGGALVAAIRTTSAVEMATVRLGVLTRRTQRPPTPMAATTWALGRRGRVAVEQRRREDDADLLASATTVVGIGRGIHPDDHPALDGLLRVLGAQLGCTRKVTDEGWLPHARQIGITGRSIAPRLFVAVGTSGKFNHMVGVRGSGMILAINPDPSAPVFSFADVGIVATWQEAVPVLEEQLRVRLGP